MTNGKLIAIAAVLGTMLTFSTNAEELSPCSDGRRYLIRDWSASGLPGTKGRSTRTTIECLADGGLRQVVEVSKDQGRTWKRLFEGIYQPEPESEMAVAALAPDPPMAEPPMAEPSAAARPSAATQPIEPAPDEESASRSVQPETQRQTTQQGSSVKVVTRELEREEIPEGQVPQRVMESPMVLEIIPGNISRYPKNSGWRSKETASFICNEVVLQEAGVGRKVRDEGVDLIVEANLFTLKQLKKIDLGIEVIHQGQVVASEELRNVRLGLSVPRHGRIGMWTSVTMRISQELFDELFAGDNRPMVRFTLTVP